MIGEIDLKGCIDSLVEVLPVDEFIDATPIGDSIFIALHEGIIDE